MAFGIPEKQKDSTERKLNSFLRKREKKSLSTKVEKRKKECRGRPWGIFSKLLQ